MRTHTQRQEGREPETQSGPGVGPTGPGARTARNAGWEQRRQPRGQPRAGPGPLPPAQPCVPLWPPHLCPFNHDDFFLPFVQEASSAGPGREVQCRGLRVRRAHPPEHLQTGPSTRASFQTRGYRVATGEQDAEDWGSRKPRGGGVLRGPLGRPDGREHTSTDRASPAPCPAPVTAGARGPGGSQRTKGHRLLSKQARTEGAEWGSSHS